MAIDSRLGQAPVDIETTDTPIFQPSTYSQYVRFSISNAWLANTTGSPIVVEIYESPDLTSASGDRIFNDSVPANSQITVGAILQGYDSNNLIAVGQAVGINCRLTFTGYEE